MDNNDPTFKAHKAHFGPISQGMIDYVTNHVLLRSRYLFTETVMRIQYAYCTHCKQRHRPDEPLKHNSMATCPNCNSKCTVKKSHVGRKYMQDCAYVVYYEKSIINPKVMTAVGFYVKRDYSGDYKYVETIYRPSCSYVFEMGGRSSMYYTSYYNDTKWYKSDSIVSEYRLYQSTPHFYSRDSIRSAIAGTPLQYSTWEQYDEQDMTKFFGLYTQYPCIEYLTKMGYRYFVDAKLYGLRTYDAIKWSGSTVEQILRLSRKDLRQFREAVPTIASGDDDKALMLRLYQLTLKDSNRPTLDELWSIAKDIEFCFPQMKPMFKFQNVRACVGYVNKQFNKGKRRHFHDKSAVLLMWRDYIKQCKELGFDLSRLEIVFPHHLHAAHESTTTQIEIKLSREEAERIARRAEELEKYRFSFDGYLIRPAASGKEIIEEGKALRHCVGGYAKDHADGKTNIFMIRKIADPDTPFYTLELKEGKIKQVYGYRNFLPTGDLVTLVEAFKKAKISRADKKKNNDSQLEVAV